MRLSVQNKNIDVQLVSVYATVTVDDVPTPYVIAANEERGTAVVVQRSLDGGPITTTTLYGHVVIALADNAPADVRAAYRRLRRRAR